MDRKSLLLFSGWPFFHSTCLQQHRPFNLANATCYLSEVWVFIFSLVNRLSNFSPGSTQTPSTFSMLMQPTRLLSTFTMPPRRVDPCSRLPCPLVSTILILLPFWTTIPMCFVSLYIYLFHNPYAMLDNFHFVFKFVWVVESCAWLISNFLETTTNLSFFPIDTYSNASLFSLYMGLLKAANSTAIPWVEVQQPDLSNGASGSITPGANTADINLRWRWPRTISFSWECRGYQRAVLRFSLSIVCSNSSTVFFHPLTFKLLFLIKKIVSYMQPAPQSMGSFPTSHEKQLLSSWQKVFNRSSRLFLMMDPRLILSTSRWVFFLCLHWFCFLTYKFRSWLYRVTLPRCLLVLQKIHMLYIVLRQPL